MIIRFWEIMLFAGAQTVPTLPAWFFARRRKAKTPASWGFGRNQAGCWAYRKNDFSGGKPLNSTAL